jgi:predicted Fe-Mo cluster-binding NifX family protein
MSELWLREVGSSSAERVTSDNPLPVKIDGLGDDLSTKGANELVYAATFAFANSDSAGTIKNIDIPAPIIRPASGEYLIAIRNPSSVTALTVNVTTARNLGTAMYGALTTFGVTASQSRDTAVAFWMVGGNGRLAISNDTILGGSDGFTGYVEVWKA